MTTLLDVQNVSKRFMTSTMGVQALQDFSFTMAAQTTLAVVGGSGSGKTTLAKILCRLVDADRGEVLWKDRSISTFTRQAWAQNIQMVFQDPYASLNPKLSVAVQLNEVLRLRQNLKLSPRQSVSRGPSSMLLNQVDPGLQIAGATTVEELLLSVGLPAEASQRYPYQFSGGQRQRIAIARALALNPTLLILDEPLSALDVQTQEQMVVLFQHFRRTMGLSYILITHDLRLAQRLADEVLVLKEGQIVEQGPVDHVLRAPQHAYTQALVEAVPL